MKSFSLVIGEMLRSVASGKDKGFRIPQLFTGEYQYSEENKGQLIGMILLGLALAALRFTKAFSRGLKPAIEEEPQKTSSNTPNKALSFSSSPTKQLGFFDKNKKRPAFVSMEQDANSVVNVSITSN
jgi:hypothetical protein